METFTDDTVVALASFLAPHDMLSLALTCRRFGDKNGTTTSRSRRMAAREANKSRGGREVRQKTESISLMEVSARTVLHAKWTDEERNALPRRGDESWIGLYQEFLQLFRLPLHFDKLVGRCVGYVEDTDKTKVSSMGFIQSSAICSNIMRSGKHTVSFRVTDDDPASNYGITCGIMRPTTNDIRSVNSCYPVGQDLSRFSLKDYEMFYNDNNVDCCLFSTNTGFGVMCQRWKRWTNAELIAMDEEEETSNRSRNLCHPFVWEGQERIQENHFRIGFVLDLDEGTLDVYKNGRRLGTLRSGLVGEYCWAVSLSHDTEDEISVTIER